MADLTTKLDTYFKKFLEISSTELETLMDDGDLTGEDKAKIIAEVTIGAMQNAIACVKAEYEVDQISAEKDLLASKKTTESKQQLLINEQIDNYLTHAKKEVLGYLTKIWEGYAISETPPDTALTAAIKSLSESITQDTGLF